MYSQELITGNGLTFEGREGPGESGLRQHSLQPSAPEARAQHSRSSISLASGRKLAQKWGKERSEEIKIK